MFYTNNVVNLDVLNKIDLGFPKNIEYKKFSSEEEWLIFRNHSIGSSDIAVISGQSHFSYPKDVFLQIGG